MFAYVCLFFFFLKHIMFIYHLNWSKQLKEKNNCPFKKKYGVGVGRGADPATAVFIASLGSVLH